VSLASAPTPFEITIRVEPADIDEQGHVNNVVYLRWAQDVATAHWRAVAPVEAQAQVGWVVLRHEIDYKAAALLGDELIVRTWVGRAPGVTFERHTEVLRMANRELLARARTIWCPINPETARPKRVAAELRARFSTPPPPLAS
jgi:acyl-CoA thioester hydrolase